MNATHDETEFVPDPLNPSGKPAGGRPGGSGSNKVAVLFIAAMLGALAVIYLMGAFGHRGDPPVDNIPWQISLATGREMASQTGRPIFVDFTQKNCPPCEAMKFEVFPDPEVSTLLDERFVPVRIDLTRPGEEAMQAAQQFGIWGTPTLVVLDTQGREIGRMAQYVNAEQLAAWLRQYTPNPPAATTPQATSNDSPTTPESSPNNPS